MKENKVAQSTVEAEPSIDAETDELREDFDYCDANRDGYLQYPEFAALLDNLEAGISARESHIGFREIDTNHDGLIDFPEFKVWWTDR
jgi:calmodulin